MARRSWNRPSGPRAATIGPRRNTSVSSARTQHARARCSGSASLPRSGPVKAASPSPAISSRPRPSDRAISPSAASIPTSSPVTGAPGMSRGPAPRGPDKAAPTAASFRDGRGCSRNRSSQSAAVPTVPGLASAGGTPGTASGGAPWRYRRCRSRSPMVNRSLRNCRTGERTSAISAVSGPRIILPDSSSSSSGPIVHGHGVSSGSPSPQFGQMYPMIIISWGVVWAVVPR